MPELKQIREPHYLLETDSSGIKVYEGAEAMNQRIYNWLAHPIGSIADNPEWGHPLERLKFEPQGSHAEVAYELAITTKITLDVDDLVIEDIKIEYLSIDEISIKIGHNYGSTAQNIKV